MSVVSQKRLAAELLKIGVTRVWVDPEDTDRVAVGDNPQGNPKADS